MATCQIGDRIPRGKVDTDQEKGGNYFAEAAVIGSRQDLDAGSMCRATQRRLARLESTDVSPTTSFRHQSKLWITDEEPQDNRPRMQSSHNNDTGPVEENASTPRGPNWPTPVCCPGYALFRTGAAPTTRITSWHGAGNERPEGLVGGVAWRFRIIGRLASSSPEVEGDP